MTSRLAQRTTWNLLVLWLIMAGAHAGEPVLDRLTIEPASTVLDGRRASAQLIATGHYGDGSVRDLTHSGIWTSSDPAIVIVHPGGRIEPRGDGQAEVVVRTGSSEAKAIIKVRNGGKAYPIRFENEVLPALTKLGCNAGACHGTPAGKNGFRLSLRGFNPALDFESLARENGTRRTNPFEPDASLILLKGTGQAPHEGGKRMGTESNAYRVLRAWVAEGVRPDRATTPKLVGLVVSPSSRVLDDPARQQQLVVRATYADGSVSDVTRLARYNSTDPAIARVDDEGRVAKQKRGETTILVSLEHLVATSHLIFREPVPGLVWTDPPQNNFIDNHVFAKLKLLRIPPSELSGDAMFCRRIHLDLIGLVPTTDELNRFLEDPRADKRERLIDALLKRPEYVDFWTLKWADRLGCNQRFTGVKGAVSFHRWIRDQVARNLPYDQFVRAIITAKGPNFTHPPASFYRRIRSPEDAVETVSQVFLGVRVGCARCHNHVADRWTQDDYYGMAAFFSQIRYKNGPQNYALYNKEETVYLAPGSEVRQPRTGVVMKCKPLGGEPLEISGDEDRRVKLVDWLVAPSNPFFAREAVNRIWYHLMGRGIVEPVDDLRESNPPASADLLDALADDFRTHGFDVKRTIRLIANSGVYQLSSLPNRFNAEDSRYFSHATVRMLSAEQLLDSASLISGVPEQLFNLPAGARAAQVPDGELVHPFLKDFGQPARADACECERGSDSTLEQALQIVGGRTLHSKVIAPDNRIGRLLKAGVDNPTLVDQLFLSTISRHPTAAERDLAVSTLANLTNDAGRRGAAEDLFWTLLNHPEFLFQH
jgi:hypothetical protein